MKPSIKYLIILLVCILGFLFFYFNFSKEKPPSVSSKPLTSEVTFPSISSVSYDTLDKDKVISLLFDDYDNCLNYGFPKSSIDKKQETSSVDEKQIDLDDMISIEENSVYLENKTYSHGGIQSSERRKLEGIELENLIDREGQSRSIQPWAISTDYRNALIEAIYYELEELPLFEGSLSTFRNYKVLKSENYFCDLLEFKCVKYDLNPRRIAELLGITSLPEISSRLEDFIISPYALYFDTKNQEIFGILKFFSIIYPIQKESDEKFNKYFLFFLDLQKKYGKFLELYDKSKEIFPSEFNVTPYYFFSDRKVVLMEDKIDFEYDGRAYKTTDTNILRIYNLDDLSRELEINLNKYLNFKIECQNNRVYSCLLSWKLLLNKNKLIVLAREMIDDNNYYDKIFVIDLNTNEKKEIYKIKESKKNLYNLFTLELAGTYKDLNLLDICQDKILLLEEVTRYNHAREEVWKPDDIFSKSKIYAYDLEKDSLSFIEEKEIYHYQVAP